MSPPNTNQKVHLRKTGSRTACGLACGQASPNGHGYAPRITDTPNRVTCEACRRSLFMADLEILRRRGSRRRGRQ